MFRVLVGSVFHETNTFWPYPTGLAEFAKRDLLYGDAFIRKFRGTHTPLGGIMEVLEKENIEIVPSLAAIAEPSGKVTKEAFDHIRDTLLEDCRKAGKLDGILLSLHGAMVTEEDEDGEGNLLEAVRRTVGYELPLIATLDLHTDLSQRMVENATAFFPYREYPHSDMYERGLEAGRAMALTLQGKIRPVMRWKPLPLMTSLIATAGRAYAPMKKLLDHYNDETPGILSANLLHGFYLADTSYTSAAALVVADRDEKLAEEAVLTIADAALREKEALARMEIYTVEEALSEQKDIEGTVVFADVTDNPGSGSSSDGTHLLRALLDNKVKKAAVATICDPETVEICHRAGVGAWVNIQLGGKKAPEQLGQPISCRAYVKTLSDGVFYNRGPMHGGVRFDLKRSAVIRIDGVSVIVGSIPIQGYDIEIFQSHGLMLEDFDILVVKSAVHYRAAFEPKSKKMFPINCPGTIEVDPLKLDYRHISRPIYPLDEI